MKSILLHVDRTRGCTSRTAHAVALAQSMQARLDALYVMPNFTLPVHAEMPIGPDIVEQIRQAEVDSADSARQSFETTLDGSGIECEWSQMEGDVDERVRAAARCHDLAIVGQHDPDDLADMNHGLAEHVVLGSGTPCLVVPYIERTGHALRNLMVAWSGTRESSRALKDSMPLLRQAHKVDLVSVNPAAGDSEGSEQVIELLQCHGVAAESHHVVNPDLPVGDVLLSYAADVSADLLICGAYGHTRLRERILGGATRHLLQHMTIPVLMSH